MRVRPESAADAEVPPTTELSPNVLFLLGIAPRSGTVYLNDLLLCHPDITARPPVWEDHLLEKIGPLLDFAVDVVTRWQVDFDIDDGIAERFFGHLGGALEQFFTEGRSAHYVLAKTPSPTNVYASRIFFPKSPVIFVVRDGRAVCESTRLTFGRDLAETAEIWTRNGREILDFLASRREGHPPCFLFRYEDLVSQPVSTVVPVLEQLGLDPSRYEADAARDLPVKGSSVWRGGAPIVHWDPVPKSAEFRPLERHDGWDATTRRWFHEMAGDVMEAFGYETGP